MDNTYLIPLILFAIVGAGVILLIIFMPIIREKNIEKQAQKSKEQYDNKTNPIRTIDSDPTVICNEIKKVNQYFTDLCKIYEDSESLRILLKNFILQEQIYGISTIIDLIYLPIKTNSNKISWNMPRNAFYFSFPQQINANLENTLYIRALKQYKSGYIWTVGTQCVIFAYSIRLSGIDKPIEYNKDDKTFSFFAKGVIKIREFFQTLCRQNLIGGEINIYKYYAFVALIDFLMKSMFLQVQQEEFEEEKIKIEKKDYFNMSNTEQLKDIIRLLYQNEKFKDDIYKTVESIFYDYDISVSNGRIWERLNPIINETLQEFKDKEYLDKYENYTPHKKNITIDDIDKMDGIEFEKTIKELFDSKGYNTEMTKTTGDQGVDIVAKKGNKTIAIQAKNYNQPVGNHAIMEVVAGSKIYNANICYVITNNYFTKQAKELAAVNNVILWDRDKLIEEIID